MRYSARLFVIVFCTLLLCGCWDRRELNTIGIVAGVGLDMGDRPGEIKMTVQLDNTSASTPGGNGGGGEEDPFINMTNQGSEVFSLIRDYNSVVTRKLYFPHNELILLGEDLAKTETIAFLDFFLRDPECRMNVRLMVVKGTAEEALKTKPFLEQIPAIDLAGIVETQANNTAETPDVTLFDYFISRITPGQTPITPLIKIEEFTEGEVAVVAGSAVFLDGRMVGELNGVETRGTQWTMGNVKSCVVNVQGSDGTVAIEVRKATSKITPVIKADGTPMVKVKIDVLASLGSQQGLVNQALPVTLKYLEDMLTKDILAEAKLSLALAQDMRSDIYGFGQKFSRYYPNEWDELKDNWSSLFASLEVEFEVSCKVSSSGMITRPAYTKKDPIC